MTIAETKRNPKDYDLMVVGTPVWAWSPSAAIRTYLTKNDLSGIKVALFFTYDSNLRKAIEKTKILISNSVYAGELALPKVSENKEQTKKKIEEWCTQLKST